MMFNRQESNFIYFIVGGILLIAFVFFEFVYDPKKLFESYDLFFNAISATSVILYVIFTYILIIQNKNLIQNSDLIKKNQIITYMYIILHKFGLNFNLKQNFDLNTILYDKQEWNKIKLKIIDNLYLFNKKDMLKIKSFCIDSNFDEHRSEERRVGKECRSRWSPYH